MVNKQCFMVNKQCEILLARYIASSSQSNALYLACAGSNFLDEKATGVHSPSRNCSSVPSTAVCGASTVMLVEVLWLGCTGRQQ